MSAVQRMRSDRAWTEEQQRAIDRRHGDLLLDASAGSGKTSVLVERFVAAALEDGIDITAMLTITFTEKAAAELRDRIRARLQELGAPDAARRTEGAFISTIHGFCARVLRANALAAGLDPHFAVLDRNESEPLAAAAFDDALDELADEADGAVDLVAAYGAWSLRGAILGVYGQLRSGGALHPRLPACPAERMTEAAAELARAAGVVAAELREVTSPGKSVLEALDRVGRCLELVAGEGVGAGGGGDRPESLWPPALEALRLPRNGAALSTDACVAYTDALAEFRAQVAARAAMPVRDLLDRLLDSFGRHYERRKRAASGLDFEDLELITRRLLADDGELCERYTARFERIMVDELQDTNRVQLELIESIARDNLFTVGDAQQSIYGFRHADVELFERRGERLAAVGARETLQTNFRSRPQIIDTLNLAFADELGDRFKPLRAGRGDRAGPDPAVELVLVDKAADWEQEGVASPWRVAEARALAERVWQLVGEGWAPGEIVVLMRATTDMRAYERALERRGLPTYVIGGRGYWSHPQVVDLLAYLRALANPRDEESVYGVLASPFVGVSLDALVILAAAARESDRDPWWVLCDSLDALEGLTSGDRSKLAGFVGWFAAERRRAGRCGPEELIDSALVASGYDLAMLAMPGGRRRLANVRKLMRLGREYEDAHGPDLHGFLAVVADRQSGRSAESRESEAPVEGEGLDAIRLMTIHRAKGLEFKLVVVADLGRSVRPPAEILRVTEDGGVGLRLARAGVSGREPAFDYKAIGDRRRAAEEAEERRLFYVAMTRAQERLVLSGALKFAGFTAEGGPTGGGPAAWIAPAFVPELGAVLEQGGGEVRRDGVRIAVRVARPEDQCQDGGVGTEGATEAPAAVGAGVPDVPAAAPPPAAEPAPPVATLSYSSLQAYHRCGYRFYAERVLGLPPVPEPAPRPGDAVAGPRSAADRGVLLHALLERLDFRRPAVPSADAVRAAAARMGLWPPPGPAEADDLAALVRRFAGSELCARLARAASTRREERFAFPVGRSLAAPLAVGAIDVLARESNPPHPERVLVVDYKSDWLAGATPAQVADDEYSTQRIVYALAALRAGARTVEIAHCFIEQPETPAVATFERSDAERLERALEGLSRGILRREFAVTPTPHRRVCAGCSAEGGLCSWPLEQTRRESPDRLF
ncbi:MAG TPA: UvrD-helicase domain-containing protein [Solirubrobacteraceae bacterium]|nr:UvrD-helicase domain-containing protein [Solirubrobacteraceae bacterium]